MKKKLIALSLGFVLHAAVFSISFTGLKGTESLLSFKSLTSSVHAIDADKRNVPCMYNSSPGVLHRDCATCRVVSGGGGYSSTCRK